MYTTSACDGWALFSNFDDPSRNITKAHSGPTGGNNQSAIQFHSVYDKLVRDASMDKYDWFIELESDHFVRFNFLKMLLRRDNIKPMWTGWTNVHMFNIVWFKRLRALWPTLNKR